MSTDKSRDSKTTSRRKFLKGAALATAAVPAGCGLLAMATAGWANSVVGALAASTGPLAYWLWRDRARARAWSGEPPGRV